MYILLIRNKIVKRLTVSSIIIKKRNHLLKQKVVNGTRVILIGFSKLLTTPTQNVCGSTSHFNFAMHVPAKVFITDRGLQLILLNKPLTHRPRQTSHTSHHTNPYIKCAMIPPFMTPIPHIPFLHSSMNDSNFHPNCMNFPMG